MDTILCQFHPPPSHTPSDTKIPVHITHLPHAAQWLLWKMLPPSASPSSKPPAQVMITTIKWPWLISNLMHKILIYLHIIYLLKSSTCFEHYPAHLQEVYVVIVYMQHMVSSLSAGDCPVHRLRKNLTGAQESHLQRVTIPEAAYTQFRRRPAEDEQGNARNM